MKRDFDMKGVSVHIGIPAYKEIPPQTALAVAQTVMALTVEGIPFNVVFKMGCCYVDQVRCFIADEFLQTQATHLFMIDSDMTWTASDFLRILANATKMECVAATYSIKKDEPSFAVNLIPGAKVNEYNCLPVHGLGVGFTCVQRTIIEQLAKKAPKVYMAPFALPIPQIFRCDVKDGHYRGEDIAFFADVAELGYTNWLDLEVQPGHIGCKEYKGSLLGLLQPPAEAKCHYPKEIPGWLTEAEAQTLARLAEDKEVLEIGSYQGKSTVAMGQTARSISSIDWHKGDAQTGPTDTLEAFRHSLARYGLVEKVKVYVGKTDEIAPTLPSGAFDMGFIDGAHDEKSVRIDSEAVKRLVRPGGVVAMHDYAMPSVRTVATEFFGRQPAGTVDDLAWFQL